MSDSVPILIGERVWWLGSGSGLPKPCTVKWIGKLPEIGPEWSVGLELEEALPVGGIDGTWRNQQLFSCKPRHGLIVPLESVIPHYSSLTLGRRKGSINKTNGLEEIKRKQGSLTSLDFDHESATPLAGVPGAPPRNKRVAQSGHCPPRELLLGRYPDFRSVHLEAVRYHREQQQSVNLVLEERVSRQENVVLRPKRIMSRYDDFENADRTKTIGSSGSGTSRKEKTSSGIFSFLRWFKKDSASKSFDSESSKDELETFSNPGSPVALRRENGSIFGSVDTLFSTATASSFAFVHPSVYRPFGAASQPEKRIIPGPETNTYRNRILRAEQARQREGNISLKEKYRLYGSEATINKSVDSITEVSTQEDPNSQSLTNILPEIKLLESLTADLNKLSEASTSATSSIAKKLEEKPEDIQPPPSTSSTPTKNPEPEFKPIDNKVPTLVRRKKKPPPPPPPVRELVSDSLPATLDRDRSSGFPPKFHRRSASESAEYRKIKYHVKGKRPAPSPPPLNITQEPSSSRVGTSRKKRKAPPPPPLTINKSPIVDIVTEAALGILNDDANKENLDSSPDLGFETSSTASTVDVATIDVVCTDTLRLERGILKPAKMDKTHYEEPKVVVPTSPVSPRPWYKRAGQYKSDKKKEAENKNKYLEEWMLESGFPRRPLHSENRYSNIFSRMDKPEEKRRSQISILTNISELDKEAAEIVKRSKEREKALLESQNAKYYTDAGASEDVATPPTIDDEEEEEAPPKTSTRELISLFNAITNVTRVTVNSKFFSRESGLFKRDGYEKRTTIVTESSRHVDRVTNPKESKRETVVQPLESKVTRVEEVSSPTPVAGPSHQPIVEFPDEAGSSGASSVNGKINKVTIEELDEYDAEGNSKSRSLFEAKQRNRVRPTLLPTISPIAEVSESSLASTPSTVAASLPRSEPRSEPQSPLADQTPLPSSGAAATPLKKSGSVWVCPRCTLENSRWRLVCDACDMWRPTVCDYSKENQDILTKVNNVVKPDFTNSRTTEIPESKPFIVQVMSKPINDKPILNEVKNRDLMKPTEALNGSVAIPIEFVKNQRTREVEIPIELEKKRTKDVNIPIEIVQAKPKDPPVNKPLDIKIDGKPGEEVNPEKLRQARLAFFGKDQNKNSVKDECLQVNTDQPSTSKKSSIPNGVEEKLKLREMLKEMKHSLPKRNKLQPLNLNKDKYEVNSPSSDKERVVPEPNKRTAEVYLVKSEMIIEEIKMKKSGDKVSSSAQTVATVKQLPNGLDTKPPVAPIKEITVPITVEKYNIKDGVLTTSISNEKRKIGTGKFELMRPRDFACIGLIKTQTNKGGHVYANTPDDITSPMSDISTTTASSFSFDQVVPSASSGASRLPTTSPSMESISSQLSALSADMKSENYFKNVSTVAVNRLLRRLETAIANGKLDLAANLAKELAQLKINCSVTRQKPDNTEMIVEMYVEDKVSHQGPIPVKVRPNITLLELKQKVEKEFEIPTRVQRWILGKQLATNERSTLAQQGVDAPGTPIFLYLVAPEPPKEIEEGLALPGPSRISLTPSAPPVTPSAPAEDQIQPNENPSTSKQSSLPESSSEHLTKTLALGWRCPVCTLVNSPTRPGCLACSTDRPDTYSVPEDYKASDSELERIKRERELEELAAKAAEEAKLQNYQRFVELEKSELVVSQEDFECPVCLMDYPAYEGVVLRECLHTFCRGCLAYTVEYSDEAEVKCPYRDDDYSCDSVLLEREIKALVSPEMYEVHLAKSIAQAETKIENAFHCKTPDCKGWCIYEDNVNTFYCPVCTHTNCLTCQAIHEGLNCRQYQEQLNQDSEVNIEAKRTKEMLQEMVDRGEAMNCPTCQVILMKKWGCDWLRCSMCRTEICWVTRGPRWGPNGKGDTSGGCRCGVNGVKCHVKCNYCH